MKILQIRFANLNSLAGPWVIDLTSSPYAEDGIFAITGPTGAGKSTILDAICLALYGRTPRLKQISKTTNEIMTRHTGECWSEVEFATARGRYRCHWSQHRARRTASGELQPPRHEIIDCGTDRPLETKIRQVAERVVEVTGMNYDQFTRSILLAQGDFNVFLQAPADERAPILEQITGTEIYSRISIAVHERRAAEQLRFDQLRRECDGFSPLAEQQLTLITAKMDELAAMAATLKEGIAVTQHHIDWYRVRERLSKEIDILTSQHQQQTLAWQACADERRQLECGDRAKELEPMFRHLHELRELQQQQTAEQAALTSGLAEIASVVDQLGRDEQTARAHLEEMRRRAMVQETLLKEVRSLDQKLEAATIRHQEVYAAEKLELAAFQAGQEEEQTLCTSLAEVDTRIGQLEAYRSEHGTDQQLVEELRGIEEQVSQLLAYSARHAQLSTSIAQLTSSLAGINRQHEQGDQALQQVMAEWKRAGDKRTELLGQISLVLGKESSDQLHGRERQVSALRHQLLQAAGFITKLEQAAAERTLLNDRLQKLARERKELVDRSGEAGEKLRLQEDNVTKQEHIVRLAARITSFEEERARLQAGTPCPLCGATVHPFAQHDSLPETDKEQTRLNDERRRLTLLQNEMAAIQKNLAATEKEYELTSSFFEGKAAEEQKHLQELHLLWEGLCPGNDKQPSAQAIHEQLEVLDVEEKRLRERLSRLSELNLALEKTRNDLESLEIQKSSHLAESEKLQREQQRLQLTVEQQTGEAGEIHLLTERHRQQLQAQLAPLTDEAITPAGCPAILEELRRRKERWLSTERLLHKESQLRHQLQTRLLGQKQLLKKQQEMVAGLHDQIETLSRQNRELLGQRQKLLGNRRPDDVEQEMKNHLKEAETTLNTVTASLQQSRERHAAMGAQLQALTRQLEERRTLIDSRHQAFLTALGAAGFADEHAFQAARMEETAHKQLQARVERLHKSLEETGLHLAAKQKALAEEKERKLTDVPVETLDTKLITLQEHHSALQQEIGALRQQLQEDDRQRQRHATRLEALGNQQREVERWSRLHGLIGSSDGKKFRNFAQGLTFEIMVHHANTSLSAMSDRYLLIHDPQRPLELQVIDNYQGGDIRSTKNLSGGESFIVSMALALGLSTMASHNVQVDSLFLDEGFGTLDEDSLQIALDTLAGLHQEGKLIGVISHVSGLRERISTQIRVIPGLGGLSRLSGPGTSKLQPFSQ